ncbi:MAG: LytTR family DNA-binding domain-containing protein [Tannerella sp.]|jgi:DNA-binding LytR/AlgR family response regulator|nr:LytTR family DNA-binding domain-containing protein [Tannerella sp.]
MNCIIVDDEPLAREAIEVLIRRNGSPVWLGSFKSAEAASAFMIDHPVDLVFLDIQMPHINGLDFARSLPPDTLVIFTTAFTEYALDSYEIEAIDYLVKPIKLERFCKAVNKAVIYQSLLKTGKKEDIGEIDAEFILVKSERRFFKIEFAQILFIEGLKDYVIIHMEKERIITKMNLKNIHEKLPGRIFIRVNKSFIVNTKYIDSFDNNDLYIKTHIVPIGNVYREAFFKELVSNRI